MALEESRDQLQFAIEGTELGTWDYNPDSNKFSSNSRIKGWFGLDDNEEIDLNVAINVIAGKDKQRVAQAIQTSFEYSSGGSMRLSIRLLTQEISQSVLYEPRKSMVRRQ